MPPRTTRRPNGIIRGTRAVKAGYALAFLLVAASGCSKLDLRSAISWPGSKPEPQTPTRLVDVWTDTVLCQRGKPGVRGFGGRVMFYGEEKEDPVVVDGTLTVFAFDDQDPNPDNTAPAKKFIFPAEQLAKHYSKSKVGHSYSFWLPWDETGGPQRQISLIARFEDREGRIAVSSVAHKTLPGTLPSREPAGVEYAGTVTRPENPEPGAVRQVTHEAPVEAPKQEKTMTTTTIDVTPSFARKLMAAPSREADAGSSLRIGGAGADDGGSLAESVRAPATVDPQADEPDRASYSPQESGATPSRSARFRRRKFPAPRGATAGPNAAAGEREPRHAGWPYRLPPTPRSGQSDWAPETMPAGQSGSS